MDHIYSIILKHRISFETKTLAIFCALGLTSFRHLNITIWFRFDILLCRSHHSGLLPRNQNHHHSLQGRQSLPHQTNMQHFLLNPVNSEPPNLYLLWAEKLLPELWPIHELKEWWAIGWSITAKGSIKFLCAFDHKSGYGCDNELEQCSIEPIGPSQPLWSHCQNFFFRYFLHFYYFEWNYISRQLRYIHEPDSHPHQRKGYSLGPWERALQATWKQREHPMDRPHKRQS